MVADDENIETALGTLYEYAGKDEKFYLPHSFHFVGDFFALRIGRRQEIPEVLRDR